MGRNESKGDLTVLNKTIEKNLKKLHEYFDSLGDISDITYSSSEFKFQIDPQSLHSDFSDIKNFLLDFQPAMKNIISSKFPATTLAYYTSFLSIHVCSSFLFSFSPFSFSTFLSPPLFLSPLSPPLPLLFPSLVSSFSFCFLLFPVSPRFTFLPSSFFPFASLFFSLPPRFHYLSFVLSLPFLSYFPIPYLIPSSVVNSSNLPSKSYPSGLTMRSLHLSPCSNTLFFIHSKSFSFSLSVWTQPYIFICIICEPIY